MSTVMMHNVMSVDGYIADPNDEVGPLFEWYANGDTLLTDSEIHGEVRISPASAAYVVPVWAGIARARELAGDGVVAVNAGDVGGQALALGLVDEVAMDVGPVVFGSGKRSFGSIDGQHLLENPHVVIQGDRVLHLRHRVRR